MPAVSRTDVAHLAALARIGLTDAELDAMAGQLEVILASVSRVQEVAVGDIPPTSHAVPITNVFRPDVERPGLSAAEALAAAPAVEDDRFRVPRILDEE
jgi:aspartyl-tRNA(Asn)/glutamyl-tRNA(Gln) amidotransferase subunit C